jgi:hypothetical protein
MQLLIFRVLKVRLSSAVNNEALIVALAQLKHLREFDFQQLHKIDGGSLYEDFWARQGIYMALCYVHLPNLYVAGHYFDKISTLFLNLDSYNQTAVEVPAGHILELRQFAVGRRHRRLPPNGTLPRLQSLILLVVPSNLELLTLKSYPNLRELIMDVRLDAVFRLLKQLGQQLESVNLKIGPEDALDVCEVLVLCPGLKNFKCKCVKLKVADQPVAVPTKNFGQLKVFQVRVQKRKEWLSRELLQQVIQAPLLEDFDLFRVCLGAELSAFLVGVVQNGPNLANLEWFGWCTFSCKRYTRLLINAVHKHIGR